MKKGSSQGGELESLENHLSQTTACAPAEESPGYYPWQLSAKNYNLSVVKSWAQGVDCSRR